MDAVWQHREEISSGFTSRHAVKRLVFIEYHETMESAILREKQLKRWHRPWKINLIEAGNPDWRDLAVDFGFEPARATKPSSMAPETRSE